MSGHQTRRAARALAAAGQRRAQADPLVRGADWRTATVATVGTDGTITTSDGIPCRRMAAYTHPAVGDQVVISRSGAGNWRAEGLLAGAADTEYAAWTPTVTGGGSATYSIREGWWKRWGSSIYVYGMVRCNAAGSGSTNLTMNLPVEPWRGSAGAGRRQLLLGYAGSITASTNSAGGGPMSVIVLDGGSGANVDQLRDRNDVQLKGQNLSANTVFLIEGWYREAEE